MTAAPHQDQRSRGGTSSGPPAPGPAAPGPAGPGRAGPGSPPQARGQRWQMTAVSALLVVAANVAALAGHRVPWAGPAAGFWLLVIHPTYLLGTAALWRRATPGERLGYSLATTLLLLLLGGLAINFLLPAVGVSHPLGRVPVLILADVLTVALYLLRLRYPDRPSWRAGLLAARRREVQLLGGTLAGVLLAVAGANRLNNGAGGQVSLAALAVVVLLAGALLRWRGEIREGVLLAVIYGLSLALLLMTSLRGWSVTGHDIQAEYLVFQLTFARGYWSIASFHNPYNACLSITILPTELAQVTQLDHPYVYKVAFQLIFAVCPVLVYTIARRYWPRWICILAVIYFIGFPTFFTDMPFLNRQGIAYIFVCAATLAVLQVEWTQSRRRAALVISAAGVELSHYSTMYLLLGTLMIAWAARSISGLIHRRWQRPASAPWDSSWGVMARSLSAGSILLIAATVVLWGGLATQTAGSAVRDGAAAVSSLLGHSHGVRAGDTSYGLLAGRAMSPGQVLRAYQQASLRARPGGQASAYLPDAAYRTPPVVQPRALPLTAAGRLLASGGVPVPAVNSLLRQAAAKGEQVFVGIGLVVFFLVRRRREQIGHEFFCLGVGAIGMVVLITVLPDLSAQYGVLRAFQEALIVIAPVLVSGSVTAFRFLGAAWAARVSAGLCLLLFGSTTGLLPGLTGGYPAQLELGNSGQYYNEYYTHPQEVTAVAWLAGQPGANPDGVQAENYTDRFAFTSPGTVTGRQYIADIYPADVRKNGWVILGYSTVHTGDAAVFYDGDLVTYVYPMRLLRMNKNLVYDNGGAEIYR